MHMIQSKLILTSLGGSERWQHALQEV